MLSIIVAYTQNMVIGNDLKIPWYIKEDLKRFKKITYGKKIILGRKTFDSLNQPLPNRYHFVLSKKFFTSTHDNVFFIDSVKLIEKYVTCTEEIFVIGGSEIFKLLLPFTQKLYITKIYKCYMGNKFFPEVDFTNWHLIEHIENNDKNIKYDFLTYKKRKTKT